MNSQKESIWLLLSALIKDITDKTQNKDKKAKEESIHYNSKPNKGKGKLKDKDSSKDKKDNKRKLYKNYKDPNVYYELENCFIMNKKL